MASRNPIICGRKVCSKCGRWRHISDFSCQKRVPFKLQSQCHACAREITRAWYEAHPEKRAEYTAKWRERNLEAARESGRERQAQRRKAPRTKAKVRRQARKAWRRMRKDPARWEARLAKQREDYQRRKQDPEWAERQRVLHRQQYENGGREAAAAKRARDKLRRRLAAYLVLALREELTRREGIAREERQRRTEQKRIWMLERKARWERGEIPEPEPVVKVNADGEPELQRLPAAPLARWLAQQEESVEAIALQAGIQPRVMRRYTTGESLSVDLGVVDVLCTRTGTLMLDIYDPGFYPVLYEVHEEEPEEVERAA